MTDMDKMDRLRIPRTLAGTIGTAVLGVLMVGVVTFGATSVRPLTAGNDADEQPAASEAAANLGHPGHLPPSSRPEGPSDEQMGTEPVPGDEDEFRNENDQPDATPAEEPEPDATPAEEPKDEPAPTDKPDAEPTAKPASDHLELDAWVNSGKVKLAWTKFWGDGFEYYKVVRSTDAAVTWPLGDGDSLAAAIGDRNAPYLYDAVDCGIEWHYRVFAVRHAEEGYKVLAASNVAAAYVECHEEPAEPSAMGFDLVQTDAGVMLAWETCTSDSFVVYKVVRSATNESPMYPLHDGDELLAAIGDPNATTFVDENVEPGQTWTYRVLSLGEGADGWVVLGLTAPKTITVE
jgi:hypothetical protein